MEDTSERFQERKFKWYGQVMRGAQHSVGRKAVEMKVRWKRKRGKPKIRWLDRVMGDIKETGLMKCTTVLHGGVYRHTLTPHKSGTKMKKEKD